MKIHKQKEHAFLIRTVGLGGKLYLTPTVALFFDLTAPDGLLTEQDLWKTVPDELGPVPFDMGYPKPRSEFLVAGRSCANRGQMHPGAWVSVHVGDRTRPWPFSATDNGGPGAAWRTAFPPEPFAEMPITWKKRFGGKGFDRNPVGRGFATVKDGGGRETLPLPNIEYPGQLIGATTDRPAPAGFMPLDVTWKPRSELTGTYDEAWQRDRWPHFPDNLNPEFFCAAPEDQRMPAFFKGDENIEINGMHPDYQTIISHLPQFRVRCFVTRNKHVPVRDEGDVEFVEVKTRAETLWLFPTALRGALLFRGVLQVKDEEFADVARIFIATEPLAEQPKSIEHYWEAQKKAPTLPCPWTSPPWKRSSRKSTRP